MAQNFEIPMTDIKQVIDEIILPDKDKYVKGVIDQGNMSDKIDFYYRGNENIITSATWFPAFFREDSKNTTSIKPISGTDLLKTINGVGKTSYGVAEMKKGWASYQLPNGTTSASWARFCHISIKSLYMNAPIIFEVLQRRATYGKIKLSFANASIIADYKVETFTKDTPTIDVIICPSGNTEAAEFDLYIKKIEVYDDITFNIKMPIYMQQYLEITWQNRYYDSKNDIPNIDKGIHATLRDLTVNKLTANEISGNIKDFGGRNIALDTEKWFHASSNFGAIGNLRNISLVEDSAVPSGYGMAYEINPTTISTDETGVYFTYSTTIKKLEKLKLNEIYTISFWAKASSKFEMWSPSIVENQTVISQSTDMQLTTEWKKFYVTFKYTNTTKYTNSFYVERATAIYTLYLSSYKLEKGEVVTDWSPAPEDKLNVVDYIGTNLLVGCNAYTKDNPLSITATKDDHYIIIGTVLLIKGETYTVNFETDGNFGQVSGTDTVEFFIMNPNNAVISGTGDSTALPKTFVSNYTGIANFRLDVNKNGATHKFWNLKVEKGTHATDYVPNLEEMQNDILELKQLLLSQQTQEEDV